MSTTFEEYMLVPTDSISITTNGTHDVTNKASAVVNVYPTLQSKSVTYTSNGSATVTADSGYDGLSQVDVTVNVSGGAGMIMPYAFASSTITSFSSDTSGVLHYAFQSCASLTEVNLPNASYIGRYAFSYCTNLASVSAENVVYVDNKAFHSCRSLTSINLPSASYIGIDAFLACYSLTSISLPVASYIGDSALYNCTNLSSVNLPVASYIGDYALYNCTNLSSVNLPVASYIGNNAFRSCHNLISLYVLSSSVCSLGSNAFTSTPIGGYSRVAGQYGSIYVPASLLTAYQSANNWSVYSSRIVGI